MLLSLYFRFDVKNLELPPSFSAKIGQNIILHPILNAIAIFSLSRFLSSALSLCAILAGIRVFCNVSMVDVAVQKLRKRANTNSDFRIIYEPYNRYVTNGTNDFFFRGQYTFDDMKSHASLAVNSCSTLRLRSFKFAIIYNFNGYTCECVCVGVCAREKEKDSVNVRGACFSLAHSSIF